MTNQQTIQSSVKGLFRFHGLQLTVVKHQGKEYIPIRPISDLLGMLWSTTKRSVFSGDSPRLYGTIELPMPVFNQYEGENSNTGVKKIVSESENHSENPELDHSQQQFATPRGSKTGVWVELKQVYLFLARTNTNQLRNNGNEKGADYLLQLQKEWGEALYHYETHGVAHKKSNDSRMVQLTKLFTTRNATRNPKEQAALTALIQQQFAELGQPLEQEPDLFNN